MRITEMLLLVILSAGIGVAMSSQTAINSQLRQYLHSPLQAALISFTIGTLCLVFLVYSQSIARPSLHQLSQIPWWLWLGGCLGVYCISMSIYTAPKLGFLTFTGVVLLGQIIMSMLLDHFGLLGVEKTAINWQRLLGAGCIAIGIFFTLQR